MRKRLVILFACVSVLGAAVCGEGADEQRQPVQEPEPPEPTQVEPGDDTVGDDVQGKGMEKFQPRTVYSPVG